MKQNLSTGGGGGVDEGFPKDTPMQEYSPPPPPPWMEDMKREAARMRDISTTAARFLEAYITSGGTWQNLDEKHIHKAYEIAAGFVTMGEQFWGRAQAEIIEKYEKPEGAVPESNIVGLDGQPLSTEN